MSIVQDNAHGRFAILARIGESIFHTRDIATLWGIKNTNTLYMTLSRYVKSGLLFRVQKGMYSIKPLCECCPYMLGAKMIHNKCYISTETVLAQNGIIMQAIPYITFVSAKSTRFKIGEQDFRSRQLQTTFLYNDTGIINNGSYYIATTERAVADMLYFNPRFHFDNAKAVNWNDVHKIQQELCYPLTNQYDDIAKK